MTNRELEALNKDRKLRQICLVTDREIEEVLHEWVEKLQIGPWKVITFTNEVVRDGIMDAQPIRHPFKYYCAVTMVGDVQIEILRPVYGMANLDRFLEQSGENLQHFKLFVPDDQQPDFIERMRGFGIPVSYSGRFFNDSYCNFASAASLGFDLEIGNYADVDLPEDIYYVYPSENCILTGNGYNCNS